MRTWKAVIAVSVALAAATLSGARTEALAGSVACPDCNVLWITMDTTRADRMGFNGDTHGLTPNLDALARKGTAFRNAYSQAPSTLLSVSSYMSGRYRHNNGVDFDLDEPERYHALSSEVTTLAEALGGAGYQTVGLTANPVIAAGKGYSFDLGQGFTRWSFAEDHQLATDGVGALRELAATPRPFFLYLHFMGPHATNARTAGFEARRGKFDTKLGDATQALYEEILRGRLRVSEADLAYIRALYDDAVWACDAQIGQVLSALATTKLDRRTLVVFASDHGETLAEPGYEHPRLGHGQRLSEELVRVPLVIAGPGVPAAKDTRVAELVDVAPTLAALVGVREDPAWRWEGQVLVGPGAEQVGPALSERAPWATRQVSMRTTTHSVVHSPGHTWTKGFDLRVDPHQQTSVLNAPEVKALLAAAEAYVASAKPPSLQGAQTKATSEDLDLLRALGYVE